MSPSTMAWISILTVLGVHLKSVIDIRKQNNDNLKALIKAYSGTSRYTQEDSSVPEVKQEVPVNQVAVPKPQNNQQKVA